MADNSNSKLRTSKVFQLFSRAKSIKTFGVKLKSRTFHAARKIFEELIYFGSISERVAVQWLLRIYQSKFRLDWEFSKNPPHFYNHRIGMAQFAFGKTTYGPYAYYRGFYSSQVIQDSDTLLDIGCGDGFFTKRFYSTKCNHVDGIDKIGRASCRERV